MKICSFQDPYQTFKTTCPVSRGPFTIMAIIPLSGCRSNEKFSQNLQCSGWKCALMITGIFSTCHDSVAVMKCVKLRCDRANIYREQADFHWIWNSIEIPLVGRAYGLTLIPAWISNHTMTCGMKLLIHSQTSTVQPLIFGYRYAV